MYPNIKWVLWDGTTTEFYPKALCFRIHSHPDSYSGMLHFFQKHFRRWGTALWVKSLVCQNPLIPRTKVKSHVQQYVLVNSALGNEDRWLGLANQPNPISQPLVKVRDPVSKTNKQTHQDG